ncbi:Alpha/Beta hydrolase protein, partial [Dichotomocladium elegans]
PGGVIEQDIQAKSEGRELLLTILRPADIANDEMLPIVLYFHGGAYVFGSKYTHGKLIRQLCLKANAVIVFLNYSLAPEAQFPTIHEEAYATLTWVIANHSQIHGNINCLGVCGDSAGGNLAAALPLMARDRGLPADTIKTQILLYPQLDHAQDYQSYTEFGHGKYGFSADDCKYFAELYPCQPDTEGYNYRYPIYTRKEDLKGLPPALIVSVEADCLRDEAETYARMLLEAGVDTATS